MGAACHVLNRCKKCIEMEGLSGDCENGDPDQGKYDYSANLATGVIDCNPRGRNNDCKISQCLCDKAFAEQLASVWADADFDNHLWTTIKNTNAMANAGTPVFDYDATCTKISGGAADACCGAAYPNK